MAQTTAVFTDSDVGCWVDGAYGMDHARDKVAEMLVGIDDKMSDELGAMSDEDEFLSEAIDAATDLLNDHVAEGLCFVWYAGDLILMSEEDTDSL